MWHDNNQYKYIVIEHKNTFRQSKIYLLLFKRKREFSNFRFGIIIAFCSRKSSTNQKVFLNQWFDNRIETEKLNRKRTQKVSNSVCTNHIFVTHGNGFELGHYNMQEYSKTRKLLVWVLKLLWLLVPEQDREWFLWLWFGKFCLHGKVDSK